MRRCVRTVLIIVSYIATVVINYLAQVLPFNGVTSAEVSDSMPTLFAPPGFTFVIWGVIYFLLGALVLYRVGVFPSPPMEVMNGKDDWLFIGTGIMNIAWIFCWHYGYIMLSVIAIVLLLIILATLYSRITRFRLDGMNKWFLKFPISVYFGWITVATIANISAWLVDLGWNGFGLSRQLWTMIVLLIGTCIGVIGTYMKCSYAYGMVFIWAYFGILYKHLSSKFFDGKYILVIITTVICLIVLLAAEILTVISSKCRDSFGVRKEY